MPDNKNYNGDNKHENGNPVNSMHQFQIDITFGTRLTFTKNINV